MGFFDWLFSALRLSSGRRHRVRISRNVEFHIHLDADRDGTVEDDRSGLDSWEWGADEKGAIVLVNSDDDDGGGDCDHVDDAVNGADDVDDLAPLVLKRVGPDPVPPGWQVELSVDGPDLLRIFDRRAAGGTEIIGPTAGDTYQVPDLTPREIVFGMEATDYAGRGFDGLLEITLRTTSPEGQTREEAGIVRVAPWIMPNHLDPAETVFVVRSGAYNRRFRRELRPLVQAAGCNLVQHASNDIWMQDCMEIGSSHFPGQSLPVALRALRPRPLQAYPPTLIDDDFGYHEEGTMPDPDDGSTFDSHGNLEVTPPCTSGAGKEYPWGRIYCGSPGRRGEEFDEDVLEFLRAQVVQEPIEVNTTWLTVAHVDEILTFVPGGPKGFSMLISSPDLAYQILEDCVSHPTAHEEYEIVRGDTLSAIAARHSMTWQELYNYDGGTGRRNRDRLRSDDPDEIYPGERILVPRSGARMLVGRSFPGKGRVEKSVREFLAQGMPEMHQNAGELRSFNDDVQDTLNDIRNQFVDEIGLNRDQDIIELPVIYMENENSPGFADALTAGVANMLVLNGHCIIPKPFGPVIAGRDLFEEDIRTKLEGLGLVVNFLDDWDEYHVALGEVHCGTNTLRTLDDVPWWEFEP